MSGFRTKILLLSSLAPLCGWVGGCATVSVYESSASAEIALTAQQSRLHKAAEAYCEQARAKGLATGETSFGTLAAMLTGAKEKGSVYWTKLGGDKLPAWTAATRVRSDVTEAVNGLTQLDGLARAMMAKTQPAKDDVTQFELALIHARQSRDSFAHALVELNKRATTAYLPEKELASLDKAISTARSTADDLAAARAAPAVAQTPSDAPPPPPRAKAG